jgi:hypothetical protein
MHATSYSKTLATMEKVAKAERKALLSPVIRASEPETYAIDVVGKAADANATNANAGST